MMIIYLDGMLELRVVWSSYPRFMWMTMITSASIYMLADMMCMLICMLADCTYLVFIQKGSSIKHTASTSHAVSLAACPVVKECIIYSTRLSLAKGLLTGQKS